MDQFQAELNKLSSQDHYLVVDTERISLSDVLRDLAVTEAAHCQSYSSLLSFVPVMLDPRGHYPTLTSNDHCTGLL